MGDNVPSNEAQINGNSPEPKTSTPGLSSLQSAEKKRLLDVIEDIRDFDIYCEIELPQLVVCGKQSAGKSSVLEAISEIPFPRKDGICTRFATVIRFHKSGSKSIEVNISPASSEEGVEPTNLKPFSNRGGFEQLPSLIDQASKKMGVSMSKQEGDSVKGPGYSKDVLKMDIRGSNLQITLVDLPGLIQYDSHHGKDVVLVEDIVGEWVRNKRSIILAILSASDEPENQGVLLKAKEVDPNGERTFAIITQPDLGQEGSVREERWVKIAQNQDKDFTFQRGWHVLLNRDSHDVEKGTPSSERDEKERNFFTDGTKAWSVISEENWGIEALRTRLSHLLYEHTKLQLPFIQKDIRNKIIEYEQRIKKLDASLDNRGQMWKHLRDQCNDIGDIVKEAAEGKYNNDANFFSISLKAGDEKVRWLRTNIQDQSDSFYENVITKGHGRHFAWDDPDTALDNTGLVDAMVKQLEKTIGQELQGQGTDPQRLNLFFQDRSEPWWGIAKEHIDEAFQHCQRFLKYVTTMFLFEGHVQLREWLWTKKVLPALEIRKERAMKELERLEQDRKRPANTRNKAFLEQSQQAKNVTVFKLIQKGAYFADSARSGSQPSLTPTYVAEILDKDTAGKDRRADAERFLKDMLIYYNIARDVFVDNVLNQVVKRHLLADLHKIFWNALGYDQQSFDKDHMDNQLKSLEAEKGRLEKKRNNLQKCLVKVTMVTE